jgi:hypothetical protein
MAFNAKLFDKIDFAARTADVTVRELQPFFGDGEAPVFTVRGLDAEEFAAVRESVERARSIDAVIEGLTGNSKERAEAVRRSLGITGDVPADLVRRFDIALFGCVTPKLDREIIIKLARCYPTQFFALTNKILQLTGEGMQPGKLPGSGTIQESETPSPSAS